MVLIEAHGPPLFPQPGQLFSPLRGRCCTRQLSRRGHEVRVSSYDAAGRAGNDEHGPATNRSEAVENGSRRPRNWSTGSCHGVRVPLIAASSSTISITSSTNHRSSCCSSTQHNEGGVAFDCPDSTNSTAFED